MCIVQAMCIQLKITLNAPSSHTRTPVWNTILTSSSHFMNHYERLVYMFSCIYFFRRLQRPNVFFRHPDLSYLLCLFFFTLFHIRKFTSSSECFVRLGLVSGAGLFYFRNIQSLLSNKMRKDFCFQRCQSYFSSRYASYAKIAHNKMSSQEVFSTYSSLKSSTINISLQLHQLMCDINRRTLHFRLLSCSLSIFYIYVQMPIEFKLFILLLVAICKCSQYQCRLVHRVA